MGTLPLVAEGKWSFWKVPLAGGTPEQLSDKSSTWAAVLAGWQAAALRYFDEQAQTNKMRLIPVCRRRAGQDAGSFRLASVMLG